MRIGNNGGRVSKSRRIGIGANLNISDSLSRDLDSVMYQDAKNRMNTFEIWSRKRLGEIRQRVEKMRKMRFIGRQSLGWTHTREFRENKYAPVNDKLGYCSKIIYLDDGTPITCNKYFRGSKNRKYCDEHSSTIKFRGRSVDGL